MPCISPIVIKAKTHMQQEKFMQVPCGQCEGCLQDRANMWSIRLKEEYKACLAGFFITLTYSPDNLPIGVHEGIAYPILRKKDTQLFWKKLRKRYPNIKIRYYLVGEYGSKGGRPHYHALVFFNKPVHKDLFHKNILIAWDKGMVDIGKIEPASIAYCSKYCLMKLKQKHYLVPPFSTMSNGIGKEYLTKMTKYHVERSNSHCHYTKEGGQKVTLPRYYRDRTYTKGQMLARSNKIQSELYLKEQKEIDEHSSPNKYFKTLFERKEAKKRQIQQSIKQRKL